MAYLEEKTIRGKKYYFLAENIRIGIEKWKKVRIYLGSSGMSKQELESKKSAAVSKLKEKVRETLVSLPKKRAKILTKEQIKIIEEIKNRYQTHLKKLAPEDIAKLEEAILTDFTYNTNSIEGSTLSPREVGMILYESQVPKGKDLREIYGATNMKKAYEYTKSLKKISEKRIKELHKIVMQDILSIELGEFRSVGVFIRGSRTCPPEPKDVKKEIRTLLAWFKANEEKLHPFELACKFHIEFERIHPFRDGNGRAGRLLMNFVLIKAGFPLLDIPVKTREKYFTTLEMAHVNGNFRPFINYAFDTYVKMAKNRRWL